MLPSRQHRVRALEAIERTVKQFRTRDEVWPLYVPRQPISIDSVIRPALDGTSFDPLVLRARTLLWLEWPDGTTWELWTIALGSNLKLYCDTDRDETRMLATARRGSEVDTDRLFLELLADSGGEEFGIAMSGGPPSRVRSSIEDRGQLIDFFVALFEVEGLEREIHHGRGSPDFRSDVADWLDRALRAK